jgi:hypothetical protein
MRLLANVKMLDREDLYQAMTRFLKTHPEFEGAWVAPFGDTKDSGIIQSYYAEDARAQGLISESGSLERYVARGDGRPIIFVDDICGSGSQACDILAAMLGREELRRKLGEHREKLPEEQATVLRSVPLAFLFVAGWKAGLDAIREICPQLGLNAKVFAMLTDDELQFAPDVLVKEGAITRETADAFMIRCAEIGRQLIRCKPRPEPLAPDVVEERALGYGNRGLLLVTSYNTPSHTLTALWEEGVVDGQPWKPLFPRRKKT